MFYLSQMLGRPVLDMNEEEIGRISDLAIAAGEVFPRITSLAFKGPANTPLMISWRKYVDNFDGDAIHLNVNAQGVRFSYLQPDEILLSRDLMSKQIVDTQGLKVVRVNDLKLSSSRNQLRLLGAEVGVRGILRGIAPWLEKATLAVAHVFGHDIQENIIAWNYMDLLEHDLSQVKLSVTHKRLHELHPADVADIIEQLDPHQRAEVFEHLDNAQAADAISELEDEYQSDVIDDLSESRASKLLATMDPDDAADIIGDLPYEKAETLLRIMGVQESRAIRRLLGYREKTAGGIMTTQFFAVPAETTVGETIEKPRALPEDHETVQYVYVNDTEQKLVGVLSLRTLVLARNDSKAGDLAFRELITADPDDDQEEVADNISKYSLLAMPVVDEDGKLLGIVTVDDAMDVMEEEHDEDLALAGAQRSETQSGPLLDFFRWFFRYESWVIIWALVACVLEAVGGFNLFLSALIIMPLVLTIANDVTTYAVTALVDYEGEGEAPSLARLLGRDVFIGVIVVLFCTLVAYAVIAFGGGDGSVVLDSLAQSLLPALIAIFVVIACSAFLTTFARHKQSDGKVISSFRFSLVMMLVSVMLLLGCTALQALIQGTLV